MRLYAFLVFTYCVLQCHAVYVLKAEAKNEFQLANPVEKSQDVNKVNALRESQSKMLPNIPSPPSASFINNCSLSPELIEEIHSYQDVVNQIINYVVDGEYKGQAYDTLAELVDNYGPRLTGSGMLEAAIDFMLDSSRTEGLDNVRTEDVVVPHWERNNESAWLTLPRLHELNILGLGSSVGTPEGGIRAPVLVVKNFVDLEEHAEQASGSIVVYNLNYVNYGEMSIYRIIGASAAAKLGAVACLVSSITDFSINSPHTGIQVQKEEDGLIPAASITVEDAAMMGRMQERGDTMEILLTMNAINYPETTSRNTIAELEGYELPQEVVVVSGHLDSWDVGQGAMDDGGGVTISWNAAVVLKKLGLRPRRTLRVILWTGEEQGLIGGQDYYDKHVDEKENFQLLMESDIGTFSPLGIAFSGNEEATCIMQEIMQLLKPLNTTQLVSPMDGGPDIDVWKQAGVPTGSLYNANDKYFWFHHSEGDTMSVEDPDTLDRCLALWTSVAYVTADMTHRLPHESVNDTV